MESGKLEKTKDLIEQLRIITAYLTKGMNKLAGPQSYFECDYITDNRIAKRYCNDDMRLTRINVLAENLETWLFLYSTAERINFRKNQDFLKLGISYTMEFISLVMYFVDNPYLLINVADIDPQVNPEQYIRLRLLEKDQVNEVKRELIDFSTTLLDCGYKLGLYILSIAAVLKSDNLLSKPLLKTVKTLQNYCTDLRIKSLKL